MPAAPSAHQDSDAALAPASRAHYSGVSFSPCAVRAIRSGTPGLDTAPSRSSFSVQLTVIDCASIPTCATCADLQCFTLAGIIADVGAARSSGRRKDQAPSSSGLGRHPLKVEIAGSNPAGVTKIYGPVV